jgi:hypothetical protein
MRWTQAASGAWSWSQGGLWSVSEHSAQTTGEAAYGKTVWSWHPLLVLSLAKAVSTRPGADEPSNSRGDGDKKELVAGESAA